MNKRFAAIFGIGMLAVVLALTLYWTFSLRFESGDMFPAGSTFNADPEGSMIFYESLANMNALNVDQNRKSYEKLFQDIDEPQTALLLLSARDKDWDDEDLNRFVKLGGNLILTCYESGWSATRDQPIEVIEEDDEESDEEAIAETFQPLPLLDKDVRTTAQRISNEGAPEQIPWESGQVFDRELLCKEWAVIYAVDDDPVIISKTLGKGTITAVANNFLLCNEAMFSHRQPQLYAWLLAQRENIIFDEYHLGIVEPKGLTALMLSYNLKWLFIGFTLPFLLYVWKGLVPLLPAQPPAYEQERSHQTSLQSFSNLMLRYISPAQATECCLNEWVQNKRKPSMRDKEKIAQARNILQKELIKPKRKQNFFMAYAAIKSILNTNSLNE